MAAGTVIRKSITVEPLTVFDADELEKRPVAPPNESGAVTVKAFADAIGFVMDTRTRNVVPAT